MSLGGGILIRQKYMKWVTSLSTEVRDASRLTSCYRNSGSCGVALQRRTYSGSLLWEIDIWLFWYPREERGMWLSDKPCCWVMAGRSLWKSPPAGSRLLSTPHHDFWLRQDKQSRFQPRGFQPWKVTVSPRESLPWKITQRISGGRLVANSPWWTEVLSNIWWPAKDRMASWLRNPLKEPEIELFVKVSSYSLQR